MSRTPSYWTDERIRALKVRPETLLTEEYDASNVEPIEYSPGQKSHFETRARSGQPLAIHLTIHSLERLVYDLTPFYGIGCPVALIMNTEHSGDQILRGKLETIALAHAATDVANGSIYVLIG